MEGLGSRVSRVSEGALWDFSNGCVRVYMAASLKG